MSARIRFDTTPTVVTVYCTCGWRELADDREQGRKIAARHEVNVHPESWQIRDASRIRATRQAQANENVRIRGDHGRHDPG